jgi:apolipoprotein N-acyltransferase
LTPLLAPLLALLAGVAHTLSFAPFDLPPLQLVALAVLIALVQRERSWQRAALAGFAFGLGWFCSGVNWVYISMHDHGDMPFWAAAPATAGLCSYLSLYPALAAGVAYRVSDRPGLRLLLAWPAAWALSEWLRGTVLTGMPWIASGYAHTDGPLAGFAPVLGAYGLCLIAAAVAGALVALVQPRSQVALATRVWALGIVLTCLGCGLVLQRIEWTHPIGAPIQVKLVQGNIAQDLKFSEGGTALAAQRYSALLPDPAGTHADLIVLPESAFGVPLLDLPPETRDDLLSFAGQHSTALVFGIFLEQPRFHYFNSALGVQGQEAPQEYRKHHLVPFGEYIPFGFRWFVDLMHMPIGDQDQGAAYQPPMQLTGQRIALNICFEDLFGAEIIRAWHDPAREPTLMLNLSNLAWFNDSIALPQHLQISRMRSLETGLPMLRATNTGATAIIDAHGRVVSQLPFNLIGTLRGEVTGYQGHTPYVRYGNIPTLVLAVLLLVSVVAASRRFKT